MPNASLQQGLLPLSQRDESFGVGSITRRRQSSLVAYDALRRCPSTSHHKQVLLRGTEVDWGEEAIGDKDMGGTCSTPTALLNLAMSIMGCGILALPKVYESTGVLLGLAATWITYALTIYSAAVLVRISNKTGIMSYGDMMFQKFGGVGFILLQLSIGVNNIGVLVTYFILLADLLVGSAPVWDGMLPNLLNIHDGPWYLTRWAMITLCALFEFPLLYLRDLGGLELASTLSAFCSLFFSLVLVLLAAVAALRGKLAEFYILPDPLVTGTDFVTILVNFLSILPVMAIAFICHFNVLPIKASLKDKSPNVMYFVMRMGALLVTLMYCAVSVSGYAMFGRNTQGNVFINLTPDFVAAILPEALASLPGVCGIIVNVVKFSVIFMLVVTFVLKNWGLREVVSEVLFSVGSLQIPMWKYVSITYGMLAFVWAISICIPSVFIVMCFVGSTACVMFGFIFPGLLQAFEDPPNSFSRACGWGLSGVGVVCMVVGLYGAFQQLLHP